MRFATIYLEENKIEVFNSLFGKETIKVNDEVVSQKFSFLGTEHNFKIKEKEEFAACKMEFGLGLNGVVISLHKNNKPIIEPNKNGKKILIPIFIIALSIGFTIGFM